MMISSVTTKDAVATTSDTSSSSSLSDATSLGKDEFLTLLIAQLENQDPLEPMENTEFASQLAQFSSLEQMTNVNTNLESIMAVQETANQLSVLGFIGKEITYSDGSGIVTGISYDADGTYLMIGDTSVNINDVTQVE